MYNKIINIINTIFKTFISLAIAMGVCALIINLFEYIYPNKEQDIIHIWVGIIFGVIVFLFLCPYDTKHSVKRWIKNWRKPSGDRCLDDASFSYIMDGLSIVYPDVDFADKDFINFVATTAKLARNEGIENKVAILLFAIQAYTIPKKNNKKKNNKK